VTRNPAHPYFFCPGVSILFAKTYSRHNQTVDYPEAHSYLVKNVKLSLLFPVVLFFLIVIFALFIDTPASHILRKKCMWSDSVMLSCLAKHQHNGF